jgi:hypothetical protein
MEVLSTSNQDGRAVSRLKIVENYDEPKRFEGRTFSFRQPASGEAVSGAIAFVPSLTEDEQLIGFVDVKEGVLRLDAAQNSGTQWMELPAREGAGAEPLNSYTNASKWAKTYGAFHAMSDQQQEAALKRWVRSEMPVTARWAAHLLGDTRSAHKNVEVLRAVAKSEDAPLHARLAASATMAEDPELDWRGSAERRRMLLAIADEELARENLRALGRQVLQGLKRPEVADGAAPPTEFPKAFYVQIANRIEVHLGENEQLGQRIVDAIRQRSESLSEEQ